VSSGLGMCDGLNSLVCNYHFAPYDPVRLMYEKRTASIQKSSVPNV